ncbi:MAG: DASS family sodium-coupled anion symporter [Acidobacteriota bacterium]|nr:DASS family sodium-coupled anion symporter [Blastocatellia bacterium]MDW8238341.1 DASS family sodium-coupled anion symporter [Acidobacteriota bacterium]
MTRSQPTRDNGLTIAEWRFDRLRRQSGFVLAPLVFIGLLLYPMPSLTPQAHRLAAIAAATAVLWMTESLPLPVTALLAATACVVLRVAKAQEVFPTFADPVIFLFIGSFILARAIFVHHLDRRLAEYVINLPWIGARPARVLWAMGALTFFISMWISNTATAAMMLPIGLSIIGRLPTVNGELLPQDRRYAAALMLIIAYAASVGGIATPVGTPPNVLTMGFLRQLTPYSISFFGWMLVALPITLLIFGLIALLLAWSSPASVNELSLVNAPARGSLTRAQRSVAIAFTLTVTLWILPGAIGIFLGPDHPWSRALQEVLPESVASLIGAVSLFILPADPEVPGVTRRAMRWSEAAAIDWGTVLLFGGGLTLGHLLRQTGLAEQIGEALKGLVQVDSPLGAGLLMIFVATLVSVLMSEFLSNTASATMLIPIVIATAQSAQLHPLPATLGAAFGATMGFMLPVSTPPNAIAYGSGYIPITRMVRYGVFLDVIGIITITVGVYLLSSLIQ